MKHNLNEVARRVGRLEKAVFGSADNRPQKLKSGNVSLPDRVLALRDASFFKQPKTAAEVHAKLQPTYARALDRVVMGMSRLSKRKCLRMTSKVVSGKRLKAYVW